MTAAVSKGQTNIASPDRSRKQATFLNRVPVHCITPYLLGRSRFTAQSLSALARTEQELTAIPLEPLNKVEEKTEASKCTTRGIHKQEMLKLGNGNLKDRAVL